MRKFLLTFCMAMFAVFGFAGGIKLISGNAQVLKEAASASFVLDLNGTRWEEDDDFKVWCGKDYEIRIEKSKTGFISGFNVNSRNMKISGGGNTKYSIIVKVNNFVQKCPGIPCYLRMYGTISIVDNNTSETICLLEIDGLKGGADYTPDDRFLKCFNKLAKTLVKQFSK